ncbi:hypothetical protein ACFFHF_16375 [Robertmurraya beringensis]|uniref:Uncharacterized protein n=1 Tax=Robertmurraya beringensis TaxID=641660 RepID=A0ABV6KTX8_9BACI
MEWKTLREEDLNKTEKELFQMIYSQEDFDLIFKRRKRRKNKNSIVHDLKLYIEELKMLYKQKAGCDYTKDHFKKYFVDHDTTKKASYKSSPTKGAMLIERGRGRNADLSENRTINNSDRRNKI